MAEMLRSLMIATRAGLDSMDLLGYKVRALLRPARIALIIRSGMDGGGSPLDAAGRWPHHLLPLVRPVALLRPDMAALVEVTLLCKGLSVGVASVVSKRLATLVNMAESQAHVDSAVSAGAFSLRAVRDAAAKACEGLGPKAGIDTVVGACFQELAASIGATDFSNDGQWLRGIALQLLTGTSQMAEEEDDEDPGGFEIDPRLPQKVQDYLKTKNLSEGISGAFMERVLDLHCCTEKSSGVLLTGPALAGKTTATQALAVATTMLSKVAPDEAPVATGKSKRTSLAEANAAEANAAGAAESAEGHDVQIGDLGAIGEGDEDEDEEEPAEEGERAPAKDDDDNDGDVPKGEENPEGEERRPSEPKLPAARSSSKDKTGRSASKERNQAQQNIEIPKVFPLRRIALFPAALTPQELYGYKRQQKGWHDGVLPSLLRYLHEKEASKIRYVVVLDGEVSPEWTDYLEPALEPAGRREIILSNGESCRVPETVTFVLETAKLWDVSPGLVGRCGVCAMDDALSSKDLVDVFVERMGEMLPQQKEFLKQMGKSHAALLRKSRTVSGPIKDAIDVLAKNSPSLLIRSSKSSAAVHGLPALLACVFPGLPGLAGQDEKSPAPTEHADGMDEDMMQINEDMATSSPRASLIGKPESDDADDACSELLEQPIHFHTWLASRALHDNSHWLWGAVKNAGHKEELDRNQEGDNSEGVLDDLEFPGELEDEEDPWNAETPDGTTEASTPASIFKAQRNRRRELMIQQKLKQRQTKGEEGGIIAAINGVEELPVGSDKESYGIPHQENSRVPQSQADKENIDARASRALLKKKAEEAANKGVNKGGQHIGLVALLQNIVCNLDGNDTETFYGLLASGELFDEAFTRKYPQIDCRDSTVEGHRGGKPYYKPSGWVRFGLKRQAFNSQYKDWCVAYHGTKSASALKILFSGLKRPGENGVQIAHGQVHSETGASIYLSPSIEYSAFPCYAQLFELSPNHWAQLVLLCRVRPGSFKEAPGTLTSNKHWPQGLPMDCNFPGNKGLEWLVEDSADIMVYGLMVREFGTKANGALYGPSVQLVHHGDRGPEYVWSEVRANLMREEAKRRAGEKAKLAQIRRNELQRSSVVVEAIPCDEDETEAEKSKDEDGQEISRLGQSMRRSSSTLRLTPSSRRKEPRGFLAGLNFTWSSVLHVLPLLMVVAIVTILDQFLGIIVGILMVSLAAFFIGYRITKNCVERREEEEADRREHERQRSSRESRESAARIVGSMV
eukprot:gnl/MRDRNA2_/MRDRNA2_27800_c0_seq1.p1 gnl/MRDRNA2_/MRDRNA2_27800_c0~~gnl/MRDRNA2_/MRDRNA2_27800_c0_seq1.p1  ORF type:complete len:1284 (+),score=275.08 gnl/MRDRNA2_/MRDRNA2_27800_c0_seq1:98-3853(+)